MRGIITAGKLSVGGVASRGLRCGTARRPAGITWLSPCHEYSPQRCEHRDGGPVPRPVTWLHSSWIESVMSLSHFLHYSSYFHVTLICLYTYLCTAFLLQAYTDVWSHNAMLNVHPDALVRHPVVRICWTHAARHICGLNLWCENIGGCSYAPPQTFTFE